MCVQGSNPPLSHVLGPLLAALLVSLIALVCVAAAWRCGGLRGIGELAATLLLQLSQHHAEPPTVGVLRSMLTVVRDPAVSREQPSRHVEAAVLIGDRLPHKLHAWRGVSACCREQSARQQLVANAWRP